MEKTEIEISGMTCGHCVKSVTEELTAIGATEVAIDLVKGGVSTAVVTSAAPLTDQQLTEAIAEAGYQITKFNRLV